MELWLSIIKELMEFTGIYVQINVLKEHLLISQAIFANFIVIQVVPLAVKQ